MTRVMRDSTNAADIPLTGTDIVAGYDNGLYGWSKAEWGRFPHVPHVGIDVIGNHYTSGVLDVERGDASITTAVAWVREKRTKHIGSYVPVIYTSRSNLTPLYNAMNAAGFRIARDFKVWVATLDGTKTLSDMTGVVAVQWAGESLTHGHYDESVVYDTTWKTTLPPAPPSTGPVTAVPVLNAAQKAYVKSVVSKYVGELEKELGL